MFTINNIPPGGYSVNVSTVSPTGPWTATGDTNYYIGADVNSANTFTATQTISGGNLDFASANSKIVPGASQFIFRNAADNATNVAIGDGGLVTVRSGIIVSGGGMTVTGGASFSSTVAASGEVSGTDVKVTGIGQFTQTSRFLGAMTVTGPPSSGAYLMGDWGFDVNGTQWFCTAAGSPGTWITPRIVSVGGGLPTLSLLNGNISSATVAAGSTDSAGTISMNISNTIASGTNLMLVTFAKAYTNAPVVTCQGGPQFVNSFIAAGANTTSFSIFNLNTVGIANGYGITYTAVGK